MEVIPAECEVERLETAAFTGDVLAFNNEICEGNAGKTSKHAVGGMTLVDVTNPKSHKYLAQGVGDFTTADGSTAPIAHQIHSTFLWTDGGKAYAVLVDDLEAANVDILDITDPRNPVLIAEHDLAAMSPASPSQGCQRCSCTT